MAEESNFSVECLQHYNGNTIIHIGELFGETLSNNPWGQTTSQKFQLQLGESFRCVYRTQLPNWPGYLDSLSIWCRAKTPVECDGGLFCYVPGMVVKSYKKEEEERYRWYEYDRACQQRCFHWILWSDNIEVMLTIGWLKTVQMLETTLFLTLKYICFHWLKLTDLWQVGHNFQWHHHYKNIWNTHSKFH